MAVSDNIMANASLWVHRALLVIGALSVIGALYIAGQKFFEPVPVTDLPSSRARVQFNPQHDISKHELFQNLHAFVTGDVRPSALGRPVPFVSGEQEVKTPPQVSRLLNASVIDLQGATLEAIAPAHGAGVVALIKSYDRVEGKNVYEVRSYGEDGNFTAYANWREDASVVLGIEHIAQDAAGKVWFATSGGRVGSVTQNQSPVWLDASSVGLVSGVRDLKADASGKVWVTDGTVAYSGDDLGFSKLDLLGYLTAEEAANFDALVGAMPEAIRPLPSQSQPAYAQNALLPDLFWTTDAGGVVLTTGYSAFIFGAAPAVPPVWKNLLSESALPFMTSPNGDIWSMRYTDGALIRTTATTSEVLPPLDALMETMTRNPWRVTGAGRAFVIDYNPAGTQVWTTFNDNWIIQYVSSSVALPPGPAAGVAVDRSGSLWLKTNEGAFVRFTNPVIPD